MNKNFKKQIGLITLLLTIGMSNITLAGYFVVPEAGTPAEKYLAECSDLNRDNGEESIEQCKFQEELMLAQETVINLSSK